MKLVYGFSALGIFGIECLIATRWKHMSFVRGELGDILVVILLFAMVRSVRRVAALPLASAVFGFACLVEAAQWISLADRLGFARGSWQSIVIGNTAQWSDVAMYAIGCLVAWGLGSLLDRFAAD